MRSRTPSAAPAHKQTSSQASVLLQIHHWGTLSVRRSGTARPGEIDGASSIATMKNHAIEET